MSGIYIIAPFLALLTCGGGWLILRLFWRRRSSVQLSRGWMVLSLLLFPIATYGYLVLLMDTNRQTVINTTPQIANEGLLTFDVPLTATSVDFRHAFFDGTIDQASFTIAEEDFLSWLASQGWQSRKFYTDDHGLHWVAPSADQANDERVTISPNPEMAPPPNTSKSRTATFSPSPMKTIWMLGSISSMTRTPSGRTFGGRRFDQRQQRR